MSDVFSFYGIYFDGVSYTKVSNNTITGYGVGLYNIRVVDIATNICLTSSNNMIVGNIIKDNYVGISLSIGVLDSEDTIGYC